MIITITTPPKNLAMAVGQKLAESIERQSFFSFFLFFAHHRLSFSDSLSLSLDLFRTISLDSAFGFLLIYFLFNFCFPTPSLRSLRRQHTHPLQKTDKGSNLLFFWSDVACLGRVLSHESVLQKLLNGRVHVLSVPWYHPEHMYVE